MQCRFGNIAKLALPLLLLPAAAQATCSVDGYTVVFVNGVFDTYQQARENADILEFKLGGYYNLEPIDIKVGYNQTHLEGVGDLIESVFPTFNQYDLNTILLQIHPEVTTRKILLVGHSQGTVYANSIYDYLLKHGESRKSVAVYNVATPADFVAGGGKYLTSSGDTVINSIRGKLGFDPLPANITLISSVEDALSKFPGHSFSGAYLAEASDRIVSDVHDGLAGLTATSSAPGNCFEAPEETLGYKTQKVFFSIADPAAQVVHTAGVDAYRGTGIVFSVVKSFANGVYTAASNIIGIEKENRPEISAGVTQKNFDVVKTLYGSSVGQTEIRELLDSQNQGAAAILALPRDIAEDLQSESTSSDGLVLGEEINPSSTEISLNSSAPSTTTPSIPRIFPSSLSLGGATPPAPESEEQEQEESTTTPAVLFTASTTPPVLTVEECAASLNTDFCLLPASSVTLSWTSPEGATQYKVLLNGAQQETITATGTTVSLSNNASTSITVIAYDASSTSATSSAQSVFVFNQPVVINEIAWAGTQVSSDDQWVELRNRTPYAVDASRLVLYAADGGSQYISLSGTIPGFDSNLYPHSAFYLIERGSQVLTSISPNLIAQFSPLSASGEELVLAHISDSGTTTIDRTPAISSCGGWCAGALSAVIGSSTQEGILPNTLSMERLNATSSGALASNWGSNDTYTIYATDSANGRLLGSPLTENSLSQPDVGWFCDPDTRSIISGATYHPQSSNCTYLARFIGYPGGSAGGVYRGRVGSSTLISGASPHSLGRPGQTGRVSDDTIVGASPGDEFFVALWEPRTGFPNPNDNLNFNSYFTTGVQLDGMTSSTPHQLYRTIPFTYGP